jgi:hypothetical protein
MRKTTLTILIFLFLVLSLGGLSYGWQGRMGGMEDPYGLVQDESDFLIHPSKIANGDKITFYGNYRFIYRDVMDWNYTLSSFWLTGVPRSQMPFRSSGDDKEHDALVGVAFPLGLGRMGLFFQYSSRREDFDGESNNEFYFGRFFSFNTFRMDSNLDTSALRLLYGFPMKGFNLGGEIELVHRREENETFNFINMGESFWGIINSPFGAHYRPENLFPFMFPYDSRYWETLFKGSLSGAIGPEKLTFTVLGGLIFAGDNALNHKEIGPRLRTAAIDMDGDVKGWRIGGDLWLRSPLSKNLSLPILLKVDFSEKTRDGAGNVMGTAFLARAGESYDYKNHEKIFQVETGGGLDIDLNKGSKIAAGIYYHYIKNRNAFILNKLTPEVFPVPPDEVPMPRLFYYDHSKFPDNRDHRVILRLAGEKEFSPQFTMRMGLNCFYGGVKEGFRFDSFRYDPLFGIFKVKEDISLEGYHWGIGASLGATIKVQRIFLEPFIGGGYQKLDIDGDGFGTSIDPIDVSDISKVLLEMDKLRKNWSVGGGLSIKF